jgi:hypothetical protein
VFGETEDGVVDSRSRAVFEIDGAVHDKMRV